MTFSQLFYMYQSSHTGDDFQIVGVSSLPYLTVKLNDQTNNYSIYFCFRHSCWVPFLFSWNCNIYWATIAVGNHGLKGEFRTPLWYVLVAHWIVLNSREWSFLQISLKDILLYQLRIVQKENSIMNNKNMKQLGIAIWDDEHLIDYEIVAWHSYI